MGLGDFGGILVMSASLVPVVLALASSLAADKAKSYCAVLGPAASFVLLSAALAVTPAESTGLLDLPAGLPPIGLSFAADRLGLYFGLIIAAVWSIVSVFAQGYFSHDPEAGRFHTVSMVTLAGTLGVAVAGDMFTLFLFFELMSLAAYILIIHEKTEEVLNAGFKYLLMTIGGSMALFLGMILTFHDAGTLSFFQGPLGSSAGGIVAFACYFIGFGIKAGLFPLHVWLPDAHPVAPSPASALLSGIMIKTGAFGLIRVFYQFFGADYLRETGWNNSLIYLAVVTILIGSAVAILQDDIKRRLAYSSVGQIGYVLVGLALLNQRALQGALFHIFAHALMKSSLFMAAGTIIHLTGKRKIDDLAGMGRLLPKTFAGFSVAALSMVGIPPLAGFISKWNIAWGALDVGALWVVAVLLISSFMNGIYYLPVVISAFFRGGQEPNEKLDEPRVLWMPILVMAVGIFAVGLVLRNLPLSLAGQAARSVFLRD